jgi:hypothetical protein
LKSHKNNSLDLVLNKDVGETDTLFQEIPSFLSVVKIMQRNSYTIMLLILVIRFYQTVIYKPFPKSVTAFDENILMLV